MKKYSFLFKQWLGKEKSPALYVYLTVFLYTNDKHICYIAVEVF